MCSINREALWNYANECCDKYKNTQNPKRHDSDFPLLYNMKISVAKTKSSCLVHILSKSKTNPFHKSIEVNLKKGPDKLYKYVMNAIDERNLVLKYKKDNMKGIFHTQDLIHPYVIESPGNTTNTNTTLSQKRKKSIVDQSDVMELETTTTTKKPCDSPPVISLRKKKRLKKNPEVKDISDKIAKDVNKYISNKLDEVNLTILGLNIKNDSLQKENNRLVTENKSLLEKNNELMNEIEQLNGKFENIKKAFA